MLKGDHHLFICSDNTAAFAEYFQKQPAPFESGGAFVKKDWSAAMVDGRLRGIRTVNRLRGL
jgi:hypothetical protein